jgi:hypothetical protein
LCRRALRFRRDFKCENGREKEGGPPLRERLKKCHAKADVAGVLRVASC